MKKGDILEGVAVGSATTGGKCVARVDGQVMFVQGAAPGDVVSARVLKIKGSYLEGEATSIERPSPQRVDPFCSHYDLCGGCSWQHLSYEGQLEFKQQYVIDNLERLGGLTLPAVSPILASEKTREYRNRLDFTFSERGWVYTDSPDGPAPALGFHVPGRFDKVFNLEWCHLMPEPTNAIRLFVGELARREHIPFFNLRDQSGFMRTLTIRRTLGGEVMVILQVCGEKKKWLRTILDGIAGKFPEVTSLLYIRNDKKNNTFHDLPVNVWKGTPYIIENVPGADPGQILHFRLGAKSFFQTNTHQMLNLYHAIVRLAEFQGDELVYDLYCGVGTISAFVAGKVKKVLGLEFVDDAVNDAAVNAELNGITNTTFLAGDLKDLLTDMLVAEQGKPDVVITDPPRTGMHDHVCRQLVQMQPRRIIYVSCNPSTQARDLKIFSEAYKVTAVQPVDMFPHTGHVENIVRLDLRAGL